MGKLLTPPTASLAARLLSSLEPSRYAEAARGIPTLLIDAALEQRYPPECVARLRATFPHAALAAHPGWHLRPEDRPQVAGIVQAAWQWLRGLGDQSRARLD